MIERWSWRHCAELTVDQYREVLAMPANRRKSARVARAAAGAPSAPPGAWQLVTRRPQPLMLTVRYERLGVRPGDLLLDLGCGFGRHAFEAARRGARVVALDYAESRAEGGAEHVRRHGRRRRGWPRRRWPAPSQGDATCLPFADATFDRIIASEVLEHIADDDAAHG